MEMKQEKELVNYLGKKVLIVGKATPSARPKSMRAASRAPVDRWAANGVRNVASDQSAAAHAITRFPPYLSAKVPPTMDEITYPHRNDDCIDTSKVKLKTWNFYNLIFNY